MLNRNEHLSVDICFCLCANVFSQSQKPTLDYRLRPVHTEMITVMINNNYNESYNETINITIMITVMKTITMNVMVTITNDCN